MGPGSTAAFVSRPLSFEYAAFAFAVRRTLDYLAICLCSYFEKSTVSIRKVARKIEGQAPKTARERVQRRLRGKKLLRLIGDPSKGQRSVRDDLAHYRAIDSGTYNVRWDLTSQSLQIVVVGGGERLETFPKEPKDLSDALVDQLHLAETLVFGCFRDIGLLK